MKKEQVASKMYKTSWGDYPSEKAFDKATAGRVKRAHAPGGIHSDYKQKGKATLKFAKHKVDVEGQKSYKQEDT